MFTQHEFQERCSRLLAAMERENLDLLVIFSGKPECGYVRYFTGYEPQLGILDCCFLVVAPAVSKPWTLITNAFWDEPFGTLGVQETIVTANFPEVIQQLVPSWVRRIGIVPYRNFPAPVYVTLEKNLGLEAIVDVTATLLWLRASKSRAEIEVLQKVAAIADTAAEALLRSGKADTSERDIVTEVEYSLRRAGSEPLIFSTILCSGPRTANFIALPGERRVQNGELVQLDCGPSLAGYHGDFSRIISIGPPSYEAEFLMETTALMYENCLENLRPGVPASAVATAVLGVAARRGFGPENFYQSPNVKPGFVGHGIGLANPDFPQVSTEDQTIIAEAMVINIETILRIPGKLGARIEDAVVVGREGTTRLSKVPIRLWEMQKC